MPALPRRAAGIGRKRPRREFIVERGHFHSLATGELVKRQVDGTLTYFDAAATSFYAAFTVVNMSTAYSFATAGGVTSVHQLALSAANLDAAAGAAGFGGYATGGGVTLCRNGTQP